ncbi:unnamed protein product, partial [Amoebophrya sp. A120]
EKFLRASDGRATLPVDRMDVWDPISGMPRPEDGLETDEKWTLVRVLIPHSKTDVSIPAHEQQGPLHCGDHGTQTLEIPLVDLQPADGNSTREVILFFVESTANLQVPP